MKLCKRKLKVVLTDKQQPNHSSLNPKRLLVERIEQHIEADAGGVLLGVVAAADDGIAGRLSDLTLLQLAKTTQSGVYLWYG